MDFSSIRGIIFDLDGTVADTLGAIREAINQTMRCYGYPERSYEDIRLAIGNGARKLVSRSMPADEATNDARVTEVLAAYDAAYAETYLHTRECYAGIPETVAELCRRGYVTSIVSNKQDAYVKGLAAQLFPGGEIRFAMGQGEFPTKPDPALPRWISEQTGIGLSEYVMIGDSDVDVKTARNTGMAVIGCAWGFRGRDALIEAGADVVVDAPAELLSWLGGAKES